MILKPNQRWRRVEIQDNKDSTKNDLGEPVENWSTVATRWAVIEPLQGKELLAARQVMAATTHKLLMRWPRTGLTITGRHRLRLGTRIFHFAEPPRNSGERGEELTAMLTEKEAVESS